MLESGNSPIETICKLNSFLPDAIDDVRGRVKKALKKSQSSDEATRFKIIASIIKEEYLNNMQDEEDEIKTKEKKNYLKIFKRKSKKNVQDIEINIFELLTEMCLKDLRELHQVNTNEFVDQSIKLMIQKQAELVQAVQGRKTTVDDRSSRRSSQNISLEDIPFKALHTNSPQKITDQEKVIESSSLSSVENTILEVNPNVQISRKASVRSNTSSRVSEDSLLMSINPTYTNHSMEDDVGRGVMKVELNSTDLENIKVTENTVPNLRIITEEIDENIYKDNIRQGETINNCAKLQEKEEESLENVTHDILLDDSFSEGSIEERNDDLSQLQQEIPPETVLTPELKTSDQEPEIIPRATLKNKVNFTKQNIKTISSFRFSSPALRWQKEKKEWKYCNTLIKARAQQQAKRNQLLQKIQEKEERAQQRRSKQLSKTELKQKEFNKLALNDRDYDHQLQREKLRHNLRNGFPV